MTPETVSGIILRVKRMRTRVPSESHFEILVLASGIDIVHRSYWGGVQIIWMVLVLPFCRREYLTMHELVCAQTHSVSEVF